MIWCLVSLVVSLSSLTSAKIQEPPSILVGPPGTLQFLPDLDNGVLVLPCKSTGQERLEFEWFRNDRQIDNAADDKYEVQYEGVNVNRNGYYQCRVHNSLGTAVSNVTHVLTSRRAAFPKTDQEILYATIGQSFKVECKPTDVGLPKPDTSAFAWKKSDGSVITTNKRLQIDDKGNLHFAFVTEDEFKFNASCHIFNKINSITSGSHPTVIRKGTDPPLDQRVPSILFYSNQSANLNTDRTVVVAVEGDDVSLRCFFGGSDNINIDWLRHDYQPPADRMPVSRQGSELTIKGVTEEDKGDYVCRARNNNGEKRFTTELYVYAAPQFRSRPHNVNATVNDDVTFNCDASARPSATVQWFLNGEPLDVSKNPNKFRLNNDGTSLTMMKACKHQCPGGRSDISVIQCNASNPYGSAFSNGFINIFERTVLTQKPDDIKDIVTSDESPLSVSFVAAAKSDNSTPISFQWFHDDYLIASDDVKYSIEQTAPGNSNLTIIKVEHGDQGQYKCVVSNGVSQDEAVASLTFSEPENLPTEEPPAQSFALWWLPIVVLLILLLILAIVLFICCVIYRNRGEDYLVDETERKCGNDPDKDLADADFQPFSRLETGSHSTLGRSETGSTHKLISESGTETFRRPSNCGTLQ